MRLPVYRMKNISSMDCHPIFVRYYLISKVWSPITPYDDVTLCTAIEDDNGFPSHDGGLTVVIRYCTSYEHSKETM